MQALQAWHKENPRVYKEAWYWILLRGATQSKQILSLQSVMQEMKCHKGKSH